MPPPSRSRSIVVLQQLLVCTIIAIIVAFAAQGLQVVFGSPAQTTRQHILDIASNVVIVIGVPLVVWGAYRHLPTRLLDKNRVFSDEPFIEGDDLKRLTPERQRLRDLAVSAIDKRNNLRKTL